MGYTVFARFPTKAATDKMWKFINANYRPWYNVANLSTDVSYSRLARDSDLSYTAGKKTRVIGFDYNIGDMERFYIWAVAAWMGFVAGEKIKISGVKYPSMWYDGCDHIALLQDHQITKKMKASEHLRVTDKGFTIPSDKTVEFEAVMHGDIDLVKRLDVTSSLLLREGEPEIKRLLDCARAQFKIAEKEIERLNTLWEAKK